MHALKWAGAVGVFAISLAGCSGAEVGADGADGDVASIEQAVTGTWSNTAILTNNPKMSRNPSGSPYWWGSANLASPLASVCHGAAGTRVLPNLGDPTCTTVSLPFSYTWGDVKAVAIAQNTSHVYYFYRDGQVSEGDSVSPARYSMGTYKFRRTSSFSMDSLIDADVSSNGSVYYYWQSGTTVYRTTGTSAQESGRGDSVCTLNTTLVGISFSGSAVEGWYKPGPLGGVNYSSTTLSTDLCH